MCPPEAARSASRCHTRRHLPANHLGGRGSCARARGLRQRGVAGWWRRSRHVASCQQMTAGSVTPCGDSRAAGQCCEIKRSIGALFLWGEEAPVMRMASGRPCTALCHRQRHKARWARSRYLPVWQAVPRRDVLCFFCSKKVPKIGTSFTIHFGTENYSWLH